MYAIVSVLWVAAPVVAVQFYGQTLVQFLQAKSKPGSVGADAALKCLFRGAGVGKRYQDPGVPKSTEFPSSSIYTVWNCKSH